ncbi:MAG: pseudouridine-5'-phosphate glycosidase [Proteobacteria bacterium]|nr:pseudouridine-5'-phosphate glycosidase [Pseudomonadota bacterium]MDA1356930.1 pseudouridine-5'-phosphate glycosidase [Pseudomonadota bacterium]
MKYYECSPPVRAALDEGRAVVALETSLISHGLPWPQNLETAHAMEAAVTAQGAVPATIGIYRGKIHIGCGASLLEIFARSKNALKVSLRDLSSAIKRHGGAPECGGTTVSATLHCAAAVGIKLFATGGIGGVHRGAPETFDVSQDLAALGSHGIGVICSGAKSILDLPKTLEVLESHGVPVIGYGTNQFPAFYARDCGIALEQRVDGPEEAARLLHGHRELGLDSSIVIANPIAEEFAIPWPELDAWTAHAEAAAAADQVSGKAITPYLLQHIGALSASRTLAANQALATANAAVAGQIAVALSRFSAK